MHKMSYLKEETREIKKNPIFPHLKHSDSLYFHSWKCHMPFHILYKDTFAMTVINACSNLVSHADPSTVSADCNRASFLLDRVLMGGRLHRNWRQSDEHCEEHHGWPKWPGRFHDGSSCHQLGPFRQRPVDQDLDQSWNIQVINNIIYMCIYILIYPKRE